MSLEKMQSNVYEPDQAEVTGEAILAEELSTQFELQLNKAETAEELLAAFEDVIQKGLDLGIDQDEIVYSYPGGGDTPIWSLESFAKGYLEAVLAGDEEKMYTAGDVGLPPEFKQKAQELALEMLPSKQEVVSLALETTTDLFNEKVATATSLEEIQEIYLDAIRHWQEYKIQDDMGAEVKDYDGSGTWVAISLPSSYSALEVLNAELKSSDETKIANAPNKFRFIPAVAVRKLAELNGIEFKKV